MEVCCQFHATVALLSVRVGKEAEWASEPVWTWCRREKSQSLPLLCMETQPSSPAHPNTIADVRHALLYECAVREMQEKNWN
jgi:hypothetical protein